MKYYCIICFFFNNLVTTSSSQLNGQSVIRETQPDTASNIGTFESNFRQEITALSDQMVHWFDQFEARMEHHEKKAFEKFEQHETKVFERIDLHERSNSKIVASIFETLENITNRIGVLEKVVASNSNATEMTAHMTEIKNLISSLKITRVEDGKFFDLLLTLELRI